MPVRRLLLVLFVTLLLGELLAACSPNSSATPLPPGFTIPTVPAVGSISPELLLQQSCTACHSLQRVVSAHKTQVAWEKTLRRMVAQGAQLNDAEFAALAEYLAATYK